MINYNINDIKYLKFKNLAGQKGIEHFCTTRLGGISQYNYRGLNLSYHVGDNPPAVKANRELFSKAIGINHSQMIFPNQTHSSNVGIANSVNDTFLNTDALITHIPNICICIQTADCVPILLIDKQHMIVAAIHAGWKGTVMKISEKVIRIMQSKYNCRTENIIAGIGPSIGPTIYEVGSDVIGCVKNTLKKTDAITPIQGTEKGYLNLWKLNKEILIQCGIPEKNIETAGLCTYSNPEKFYSARRDGIQTGRLTSGIIIKSL